MSKKVGLIAEDNSDIEVVIEILAKYMKKCDFSTKKFVGQGCGKLKQKCQSWAENLLEQGCDHVLIFHDLDGNDEKQLRLLIEKKVSKKKFPNSCIVIPIQELEAWLLSDRNAIQSVFNLKKMPPQIKNCEIINSPKEHLRDIVWSLGQKRYINTTHNKKIAERLSLDNLKRCSSFRPLDIYIKEKICA